MCSLEGWGGGREIEFIVLVVSEYLEIDAQFLASLSLKTSNIKVSNLPLRDSW